MGKDSVYRLLDKHAKIENKIMFLMWCADVNSATSSSGKMADLQDIFARSDEKELINIFTDTELTKDERRSMFFCINKCMGTERSIEFIDAYSKKQARNKFEELYNTEYPERMKDADKKEKENYHKQKELEQKEKDLNDRQGEFEKKDNLIERLNFIIKNRDNEISRLDAEVDKLKKDSEEYDKLKQSLKIIKNLFASL